ncbi:hypothetical protein J3Q64DRAFT_1697290 [Phycomyces blakesleeanus]|uniref:DDE-1 domain-containing protein n=1 Tax=Phycomyces blakesleeanus TaxID=4837 RepID=A0ABR3B3N0_PHYBL
MFLSYLADTLNLTYEDLLVFVYEIIAMPKICVDHSAKAVTRYRTHKITFKHYTCAHTLSQNERPRVNNDYRVSNVSINIMYLNAAITGALPSYCIFVLFSSVNFNCNLKIYK